MHEHERFVFYALLFVTCFSYFVYMVVSSVFMLFIYFAPAHFSYLIVSPVIKKNITVYKSICGHEVPNSSNGMLFPSLFSVVFSSL